jgi:hypothetical protein
MKGLRSLLAVSALATTALSSAQDIRFFTIHPQNHGLYEVVTGSGTGGRYVNRAYHVYGIRVTGFTDRVQRKEPIITGIFGSGTAFNVRISSNNNTVAFIPSLPLPSFDFRRVSANVNTDNVVIGFDFNRRHFSRRVPIGSRP